MPIQDDKEDKRYKAWKATIDNALTDIRWHEHDAAIMQIVDLYNAHLTQTPGYARLNWQLVKAMIWTESGGPTNPAWQDNPMQIGKAGDPGLTALLSGNEGGELVMPPSIQLELNSPAAATASAQLNIKAGVGYLLMRFAFYKHLTIPDKDNKEYVHDVVSGDNLATIAKKNGTTIAILQDMNPTAKVLMPKQKLIYRKAKISKFITGWSIFTNAEVGKRYNVGDPKYADKLQYCLGIISQALPMKGEVKK